MADVKGKWVFLSGPMTGYPDWNREAFARAEEALYAAGAEWVFNPAQDAPRSGFDPYGHEYWMACALHELTTLPQHRGDSGFSPVYDMLVQLPGWEGSGGAMDEFSVALAIGIECADLSEVVDDG